MNRSWLLARAADLNSGRSTSRPVTMMPISPASDTPTARIGLGAAAPPPSSDRAIRIGATDRSWNSRIENTARPEAACSRPASDITGTTTAVDDMARAAPSAKAGAGAMPNPTATAAISSSATRVCRAPRPNTWRRISRSRSHDSSRPMEKSRNTTPSSAMSAICSGLETVM